MTAACRLSEPVFKASIDSSGDSQPKIMQAQTWLRTNLAETITKKMQGLILNVLLKMDPGRQWKTTINSFSSLSCLHLWLGDLVDRNVVTVKMKFIVARCAGLSSSTCLLVSNPRLWESPLVEAGPRVLSSNGPQMDLRSTTPARQCREPISQQLTFVQPPIRYRSQLHCVGKYAQFYT